MSRVSYNLSGEAWIKTRLADNQIVELSLVDVFDRAKEIVTLAGEVSTQDVAVLRLLLAVARRAYPNLRSRGGWQTHWTAGGLDAGPIIEYLKRHRDRFDLLHPDAPFYQVAGLHTAKGEMTELTRLVADVPVGHRFFTTRSGAALETVSFAEAARWVVHTQAFDSSGIKSGAVGDDRVKGGRGYPIGIAWAGWLGSVVVQGRNLAETLLLNLPVGKFLPPPETDQPVWERDPLTAAVEKERSGAPYGPVDLLTWQSRRIRLGHDGDRVTGVLIANGDPLHPRNRFDQEYMTSWRLSEAQMKAKKTTDPVFMPRAHQPEWAVWRGLESLLLPTDDSKRTKAGRWLEWISELKNNEVLADDHPVRLRTVGMQYGSQSAVIADITDDALTLRAAVLADPELQRFAISAVHDAAGAARALGQLGGDLARASGADRDLSAAARDEAREQAFAALDADYRRWVRKLDHETDQATAQEAWRDQVRSVVRGLARHLLDSTSSTAWVGQPGTPDVPPFNAAVAANRFDVNLRAALTDPSDRKAP